MLQLTPMRYGTGTFAQARPWSLPLPRFATAVPAPVYDLNFAAGASAADLTAAGFTFSRSGTAWGPDGTAFADGVPRIGSWGLLIEGARTNSIRNNAMVGAAAGTPGSVPTNWTITTTPGLTRQIVAIGTVGGLTYLEIRWSGTTTSVNQTFAYAEPMTQITAASGQTWTSSWHAAIVGGSLAGIADIAFDVTERDAGGASVASNLSADIKGSLTGQLQRFSLPWTLGGGTTARVNTVFRINVTSIGAVVDITLRLAAPQLEQGAFMSSPILTTGSAVTRAAETCVATRSAGELDQGAVALELTMPAGSDTNQMAYGLDDGTANNRFNLYRSNSATALALFLGAGGVTQATMANTNGSAAHNTSHKLAARWVANNVALAIGGAAPGLDTSATIPAMTNERIGTRNSNAEPFNGAIRRVRRFSTALTDDQLRSLSA